MISNIEYLRIVEPKIENWQNLMTMHYEYWITTFSKIKGKADQPEIGHCEGHSHIIFKHDVEYLLRNEYHDDQENYWVYLDSRKYFIPKYCQPPFIEVSQNIDWIEEGDHVENVHLELALRGVGASFNHEIYCDLKRQDPVFILEFLEIQISKVELDEQKNHSDD